MSENINVLLVDDSEDDRMFFSEALAQINQPLHLSFANDAVELFAHLNKGKEVDLIFLDINMPVKNGKQCLVELKAHEKFKDIPVIVFTVSQSLQDIEEVFGTGAHYYIVKPYAPINFVATLKLIFEIDWKRHHPIPPRENFVINLAFV